MEVSDRTAEGERAKHDEAVTSTGYDQGGRQQLTSSSSQSLSDFRAYSIFLTFGVCFFFVSWPAAVEAGFGGAAPSPAGPMGVGAGLNELAGMSVGLVRCCQPMSLTVDG